MGLDVDWVFANDTIEKIEKTLSNVQHSERAKIADDIIAFAEKLEKKYKSSED